MRIYNDLHGSVLPKIKVRSASQKTSRLLWNPKAPLPCSQGLATGPFPGGNESGLYSSALFTEDSF